MEELPEADRLHPPLSTGEKRLFRKQVRVLVDAFGLPRFEEDGFTATFRPYSEKDLTITCRYITHRVVPEYKKGVYVSVWETLHEYEDERSIEMNLNFNMPYGSPATTELYIENWDETGEEVDYKPYIDPNQPAHLRKVLQQRIRSEGEDLNNEFLRKEPFNRYDFEQIMDVLNLCGGHNLAAPFDEVMPEG